MSTVQLSTSPFIGQQTAMETPVEYSKDKLNPEVSSSSCGSRIGEGAYRVLTGTCRVVTDTFRGFAKGVAAWIPIQTCLSAGDNFQVYYSSIFDRKAFNPSPEEIGPKARNLFLQLIRLKDYFENQGLQMHKNFNPRKVLNSDCPTRDYNKMIQNMVEGQQSSYSDTTMRVIGGAYLVLATPIYEEILFRGVIQDLTLNKLAKAVVKRLAPQHLDKLDSKIYTAARITLTAGLFSAYHLMNRGLMPDSYVDLQLIATFFMGLGFGAIKEVFGLSAAIGAHATQNLYPSLPGMLVEC